MATTITAGNATNGLAFSADNTGILELKTGTGAGTTALTISTAQAVTFAGNVSGVIKSGTAVTLTNQTTVDFINIPSTAKRITVMFHGFSTNGASNYLVQLGDAGGIEATGYLSTASYIATGAVASTAFTTGFGFYNGGGSTTINHGVMIINLLGSNSWDTFGNLCNTGTARTHFMAGGKTLSDTLTTVRITTVNGTDLMNAGTINILWE
jgi:hypothetical protein